MKILIPHVKAPFISGGSSLHIRGLADAFRDHGHRVETVDIPFKFDDADYIASLMEFCARQDFNSFNGHTIDKLVVLQFPAYSIQHPDKILWLMHQHRAVYELFDPGNFVSARLKEEIVNYDDRYIPTAKKIWSNSNNVSLRLKKFNGIESEPLYHPPHGAELFYCRAPLPYIFFPSRHESLKRQDLLISAMRYTATPVKAIIAGTGGQTPRYERMVKKWGLGKKVRLVGEISEEKKRSLYANCLAVFFGPFDEDYGYVTLEAMLSSKPVITCTDSGGPLEFTGHGETGFVVDPDPTEIADKMDWCYNNCEKAVGMGEKGRRKYSRLNISWDNVVQKLLGN